MDAAVAALLGAAIGAIVPALSGWIQQRHQSKRERLKAAADLGLADWQQRIARAEKIGGAVPPVSLYVAYHVAVLDALDRGGFDAQAVAKIRQRQRDLLAAIKASEGAAE